MLPGLGWSASDVVLAVKVITKVCCAFRDAGGANEQYASTAAFLDAFARTLQRISAYAETASLSTSGEEVSADLAAQAKLVYLEYSKFDMYLKKVEPGLSSASFASRIVARTKWAIKEIGQKVDALKKAVIIPMMFVTPLLAVETLSELKDIKSRLPDASLQEDAIRENRILIFKINNDLASLKDNLESYWWSRRWAMTAVEDDIKTLLLVTKNNSDLISNNQFDIEEAIVKESAKARQEQAAANIATISAVETIMGSRLAHIESRIDILITEYRLKTGKEDQELYAIKARIASSRKHLNEAASAARKALKHFGLLVKAVNCMHSNPVSRRILPLADGIVGYDKIFEHGEKMMKSAGQTVTASGKYVEESEVMKTLKSWNLFTLAVSNQRGHMQGKTSSTSPVIGVSHLPVTPEEVKITPSESIQRRPKTKPSSASPTSTLQTSRKLTVDTSRKDTAKRGANLLDDDFGDFEAAPVDSPRFEPYSTVPTRHSVSLQHNHISSTSEEEYPRAGSAKFKDSGLLGNDLTCQFQHIQRVEATPGPKSRQSSVSFTAMNYKEDNPWA